MLVSTADEPLSLTSITRSFVADSITPISAYLALAQPGRSCLLESVEGSERISRFSFVGLDYLETFSIDRDPRMLERIRAATARYALDRDDLPFPGGAVCVFTYDAARSLEPALENARELAPPADVRFGDALVLIPGTWLVFDHFTHRVTLIGFARDEREREVVDARLDAYVARLLDQRPTIPGAVRADGPVVASMDEATFLDRVAQAKRFIYDGDAYQQQVGIRFSCPLAGTAFDFYRQIRTRNPSPYMFFVEHDGRAVFGASPEFLVRLDGRTARIRPLAGTRPRDGDPAVDQRVADELLADQKERAEHVMLVDLARNDLGAVCRTGTVRVDELMVIERYSHVMHIVSNVVGDLRDDRDALDLFAASFPAGTVTGTP
ncbi:MAG: anthranilate synthase component, partial [Candidatus Eremiobacteraeota bacterium]|nr:anthranilate synthase component [Candidatus Eremiobacteraeota bacterium]